MKPAVRWMGTFLLLAVPLGLFGTARFIRVRQEDRALTWAEKFVTRAENLPSRRDQSKQPITLYDWEKAIGVSDYPNKNNEGTAALQNIVAKYGPSARASVGMGRLHFLDGNYQIAERYFKAALRLEPNHVLVRRELAKTQQIRRVIQSVAPQLPKWHFVTMAAPFPAKNQTSWAVVYGRATSEKLERYLGYATRQVKEGSLVLVIFKLQNKIWKKHLQIKLDPAGAFWAHHQIYRRDLTGDGQEELIIFHRRGDPSGSHYLTQVFTWRHNQVVKIFDEHTGLYSWFEDLDHDGKYEIGGRQKIGSLLAHSDMPLWPDIYTYRRGRYVLANNDFPREFKNWPQKLRLKLKQYPQDGYLWRHLGKAYETQKQFKAALQAYQHAEKLFAKTHDMDAVRLIREQIKNS